MAKINKLQDKNEETVYPITTAKAVYMEDNTTTLDKELEDTKLNSVLSKDLVVSGVTIGNVAPGTVFRKGTSVVDILEQILTKNEE